MSGLGFDEMIVVLMSAALPMAILYLVVTFMLRPIHAKMDRILELLQRK